MDKVTRGVLSMWTITVNKKANYLSWIALLLCQTAKCEVSFTIDPSPKKLCFSLNTAPPPKLTNTNMWLEARSSSSRTPAEHQQNTCISGHTELGRAP